MTKKILSGLSVAVWMLFSVAMTSSYAGDCHSRWDNTDWDCTLQWFGNQSEENFFLGFGNEAPPDDANMFALFPEGDGLYLYDGRFECTRGRRRGVQGNGFLATVWSTSLEKLLSLTGGRAHGNRLRGSGLSFGNVAVDGFGFNCFEGAWPP